VVSWQNPSPLFKDRGKRQLAFSFASIMHSERHEVSAVWQHFIGVMLYLVDISVEDESFTTTEAFSGDM
jgi:hypothetical protein